MVNDYKGLWLNVRLYKNKGRRESCGSLTQQEKKRGNGNQKRKKQYFIRNSMRRGNVMPVTVTAFNVLNSS